MIKRTVAILLGFAVLSLFGYEVKVDTVVANPGQRVTVPVRFDTVKGAAHVGVRLTYDPQVLVLLKTAEGTLVNTLADDYVVVADEDAGWVSVAAFGAGNATNDVEGTLANLVFKVREGTQGQYSDVAVANVVVGDQTGVRDLIVGDTIKTKGGMVRVVAQDAAVARLENPQTIAADAKVGSLALLAGDAIAASDFQTPVEVTGGVTANGAIKVIEPMNGWASGRYEILKTTTGDLLFEIAGGTATFSTVTNGAYITYVAHVGGDAELPVVTDDGVVETLTAGTKNQIRGNIAKSSVAGVLTNATSIAISGPDGLIGIVADMGIAPRFVAVDVAGVAHFAYAQPKVTIMSFNPEMRHMRIKVEPGSGNEIVSTLTIGYVHVYGTGTLGAKMKYISRVGFDLTPYLKADTKGEADLVVELGTHTFFKIKIETAEKADGALE